MTFAALILCGLVLVIILYRLLETRVNKLFRSLRHTDDRVSSLEIKDFGQDFRMDAHDKRLETHDRRFQRLNVEVKELGRDIGWSDDQRKTDVIKPKTPPDDDSSGNPT